MSAPEHTRSPIKREAVARVDAMTDAEAARLFPILMGARNAPDAERPGARPGGDFLRWWHEYQQTGSAYCNALDNPAYGKRPEDRPEVQQITDRETELRLLIEETPATDITGVAVKLWSAWDDNGRKEPPDRDMLDLTTRAALAALDALEGMGAPKRPT